MAGGGNFLGRVMSYIVNELVVEGLANNPSFQRFAVKTSRTINQVSSKVENLKKEVAEQIKDMGNNADMFRGR